MRRWNSPKVGLPGLSCYQMLWMIQALKPYTERHFNDPNAQSRKGPSRAKANQDKLNPFYSS